MNTPQQFPPPFPEPAPPPPPGPVTAGPPPSPFGTTTSIPDWMPSTPPPARKTGRNVVIALVCAAGFAAAAFLFLTRDKGDSNISKPGGAEVVVPTTTATVASEVAPAATLAPELPATAPATVVVETVPVVPPSGAITLPVTIPAATLPPGGAIELPSLFTATEAADVIAEVGLARGANPLRILEATIYPTYAFVQVQDPAIPANVDQYEWRGGVGAPAPVTLVGDGDLEANLFSDNEVNWAAIPALVDAALAGIPIEGAEVTHVAIRRNLPFSDQVQIRVFVNGTRSSGYLDADSQGTVINVSQG